MKKLLAISCLVLGFGACAGESTLNQGETFDIDASNAPGASAGAGGSLRIRCEVRDSRSFASVDAEGLRSGQYYARLESGGNQAQSGLQATEGDEVEFDFDSDTDDIEEGAVAIDSDFIVEHTVVGSLYTADDLLVHSGTVDCIKGP